MSESETKVTQNIVSLEHMQFLLETEYNEVVKRLFVDKKNELGWGYKEFMEALKHQESLPPQWVN